MEAYIVGGIIKEFRLRFNISQEELCDGLCAVSTLSRIESGKQITGRKLIEALFSRMGLRPHTSAIPMSKIDLKRENIEYEINDMIATGNFEIFDLLEEYKTCGNELDTLEKQFYLFYKTVADDFFHSSKTDSLENFIKALQLSLKNYDVEKLPNVKLLTKIELLLLNNIARILYDLKKTKQAIEIMEFLRSYFENKVINEEEKAKNYPVVLFNLENWYGEFGKHEEVLKFCNIGIDTCIHYGKLTQFPFHLFNKGCSLIKLGKIEDGKEFISEAFIILKAMKRFDDIEYGKKWIDENLNIKL